jgi:hypothetical protein
MTSGEAAFGGTISPPNTRVPWPTSSNACCSGRPGGSMKIVDVRVLEEHGLDPEAHEL